MKNSRETLTRKRRTKFKRNEKKVVNNHSELQKLQSASAIEGRNKNDDEQ